MIDFKLTENGDIDIAQAYQYPYFIIQYYISARDRRNINNLRKEARRYPSFRVDFDTDIKQHQQFSSGMLIQFNIQKRIMPYKPIAAVPVIDNEELAQEVTICLKTEKGEFPFLQELGSELITLRHSDIKNETAREQIRQYAEEAIKDVVFDESYTVSTSWEDDDSRYKHERLKITIDTDQDTIYEATI